MLFNSFSFLVFFPAVTILYFVLPQKVRWLLLLVASCVFYMAFIPRYIFILFALIVIDYFAGIMIEKTKGKNRKIFLILSILSTCTALLIFKYFNFFVLNVNDLASFLHWNYNLALLNIILPIGLSFHTFQSLSYVIEVYKGRQKAEKNFGIYSLYVMFYPQLVAGPIERPQNLLHQFYEEHFPVYERITFGLQRMLWGFFKKVVVADNLAFYVNKVYDFPQVFRGSAFFFATLFFAIEIYCDFSGYSDIAIGSAQVMGFKLMENFKNPYLSLSIREFWSRWHISLSTWFRDYVYIPLGGNRVGMARWTINILITFLLSGLWHGANWTFVIWGFLHGIYLLGQRVLATISQKGKSLFIKFPIYIARFFKWFVTFFLVVSAWVFFRAKNLAFAKFILKNFLFSFVFGFKSLILSIKEINPLPLLSWFKPAISLLPSSVYFLAFISIVLFIFITDFYDNKYGLINKLRGWPAWIRWPLYVVFVLAIMNLGVTKEIPFIYFQF